MRLRRMLLDPLMLLVLLLVERAGVGHERRESHFMLFIGLGVCQQLSKDLALKVSSAVTPASGKVLKMLLLTLRLHFSSSQSSFYIH